MQEVSGGATLPDGLRPAPPTRHPEVAAGTWDRTDDRLLTAYVVLLVVTHRIGVPAGAAAVSIALPLTYVFGGILLLRGRAQVDRLRAELFLIAVIGVLISTLIATSSGNPDFSITSLLLLVAIYATWVVRARGIAGRTLARMAGARFVGVMVVVAAVAALQLISQLAGLWTYEDYLGNLLPPAWTFPTYNTSIPLVFGSEDYKANAFVLLEPSFVSQYCALAVIIGLMLKVRAWKIVVLLAGLASAVSGTGIILLTVGGVLILLRAPRTIRPAYVAAAVVGLSLLFVGPTASLLLDRGGEFSTPGSSGYARFVLPYQEVRAGLQAEPDRYFVGEGAGSVERTLASARDRVGYDVLYGIVPKVVFEYGLLAGGALLLFILVSMLDRAPWRVVPAALVVMTFLLSGGLLQPQTAALAWLLTGFATDSARS